MEKKTNTSATSCAIPDQEVTLISDWLVGCRSRTRGRTEMIVKSTILESSPPPWLPRWKHNRACPHSLHSSHHSLHSSPHSLHSSPHSLHSPPPRFRGTWDPGPPAAWHPAPSSAGLGPAGESPAVNSGLVVRGEDGWWELQTPSRYLLTLCCVHVLQLVVLPWMVWLRDLERALRSFRVKFWRSTRSRCLLWAGLRRVAVWKNETVSSVGPNSSTSWGHWGHRGLGQDKGPTLERETASSQSTC